MFPLKTNTHFSKHVSTEIELKLTFLPQYATAIKQLPLLKSFSITKPVEQDIFSIYYDTPDFELRKNHIALRTRKIRNHQWIQTIKSNSTVLNGLHYNQEYEYPITANNLVFDQIPDQNLLNLFSDKKLRASLKPIFTTDFHRTMYLLEPFEDLRLEFSLDDGNIIANNKTESICEIELELKAGKSDQLIQFSRMLQESCSFELTPENANKAMRGYALLSH